MKFENCLLLLVWTICFLLHSVAGIRHPAQTKLPEVEFVHRVVLDQMGYFVLLWIPQKEDIIFEVQVRTKGYVGLGFSPDGKMKNSDVVIGWVDDSDIVYFSDRHATGNKTPVEDEIQDYTLIGGFRNRSHTVLRFSRPWITCDRKDDMDLNGETVRVIWAYDNDPPDPSRSTLNYHDYRGSKSLYLKEPKMKEIGEDDNGIQTWEIRSPDVVIPDGLDTVYWCKLYQAPKFSRKHHMIGYKPIISVANEGLVHHMLFYECSLKDSEKHLGKWVDEKGAQCYSSNMPLSWGACGAPLIAWALGSNGETFPDHVGFPIGEEHGGATYFLLEIHYDNPQLKTGIVDNSGLKVFLTDRLRPYDAGVLTLGHTVAPTMIIPPGKVWDILGHCTKDCTKKGIHPDGINVFSSVMHAHLIGSSISIQHIRDGRELQNVAKDRSYDFNFQQSRYILPERKIYPGDDLIVTCTYDATRRTFPTFGGFGTKEEMCLAFLHYYPRIAMGECISRIDLAQVFNAFGVENLYDIDNVMTLFNQEFNYDIHSEVKDNLTLKQMKKEVEAGSSAILFEMSDFFRIVEISQPPRMRGKSFHDILMDESVWRDPEVLQKLKDSATKFQFEPKCYSRNRSLLAGVPKKARYPRYRSYYEPDDPCTNGIPYHVLEKRPEPPMDVSAVGVARKGGAGKLEEPSDLQTARRSRDERGSGKQNQASVVMVFLSFYITISSFLWRILK